MSGRDQLDKSFEREKEEEREINEQQKQYINQNCDFIS